jgi:hypothetical protein
MHRRRRLKDELSEIYLLTSEDTHKDSVQAENIFDTPCLVCASCGLCIAGSDHMLEESIEYFAEAAFSYDFEVLNTNVKCYSATNPATERFDVIRFRSDVDFVVYSSKYTATHSWFSGFAWTACSCQGCGDFLGWRFQSTDDTTNTPSAFFGLIITRLRPRLMVGLFATKVMTPEIF